MGCCAGHISVGTVPGWRFAFLSVAAVSYLIGGLTLWLGQDPRKLRSSGSAAVVAAAPKEGTIKMAEIKDHMISVMRVPTFGIIVAQVRPYFPLGDFQSIVMNRF